MCGTNIPRGCPGYIRAVGSSSAMVTTGGTAPYKAGHAGENVLSYFYNPPPIEQQGRRTTMMTLDDFLEQWHKTDDKLLVHTSGSTGSPKPMWVEKEKMRHSARITCRFLDLQPGDTALLCMPLDYIAGKMMVVRCMECGLRLVSVPPGGHPLADTTLPSLDFAAMVPMQVYNSLQVPQEREKLRNIKHLMIGGGAIDSSLEQELSTFPHHVWSTYGMTETLSHIALRPVSGPEASLWYRPFDSVNVSTGEDGCLVIDAPMVCDGTLVTHDIVDLKLAADGKTLFRIKGRKDNVICCGGIKIQAEEVEEKLRPHLLEPFMIAKRKDPKFGEVALLVTEGTDLLRAASLCRSLLPKYWVPKDFIHVDKLPLTETGKPRRSYYYNDPSKHI